MRRNEERTDLTKLDIELRECSLQIITLEVIQSARWIKASALEKQVLSMLLSEEAHCTAEELRH